MSYILDALKKSEREKTLGQVPTLETVIADGAKKQPKVTPWWLNLLVFLLVLSAVLVGMYFAGLINFDSKKQTFSATNHSTQDGQTQNQTSQSELVTETTPVVTEQEMQQQRQTPVVEAEVEETVNQQAENQQTQSVAVTEPETQQPVEDIEAIQRQTEIDEIAAAQEQALLQREAEELAASEQAEVVDVQEPVVQSEPEVQQPAETEQAVAAQSQNNDYEEALHQNLRNIAVNVVSYSSDARQRFVMLDLTIYKEGDSLPNGADIIEIQRTGAIVGFQNKRYLLKP